MAGEQLNIAHINHGFGYFIIMLWTDIPGVGAELAFERIHDGTNQSIWCELSAFVTADGKKQRVLPPSRVNLQNATKGQGGWPGHLDRLNEAASSLDWRDILSTAVGMAIDHHRNGGVATELAISKQHEPGPPWLIEPLVTRSGVSVLFGEGGTGKSTVALAAAISVASKNKQLVGTWSYLHGPVIYFDYEDDDTIHIDRLNAIARGHDITKIDAPIFHYSLVAKVTESQDHMRRLIRDHEAVFAVVDSIGLGRGGSNDSAEDTIRLFRALRSLGIPVLALDHVTKEDVRKGSLITPYGSVYTINSARILWGAITSSISTRLTKYITFANTKSNHVAPQQPFGIKLQYGSDDHGRLSSIKVVGANEWWDTLSGDELDTLNEIRGIETLELEGMEQDDE